MCLIIASVCIYLSYSFFADGQYVNGSINGIIALFFIIMMVRNIKKTKEYMKEKKNKK